MRRARKPDQNGNMLFIVLVGIALLGFLTLVLSRGSETTEDTGSTESMTIRASEILRGAGAFKETFGGLVTRGCSEYQVSFENTDIAGYANANAPTNESCHMFERAGGGMIGLAAKTDWLDPTLSAQVGYGEWSVSNNVCIEGIGTDAGGCDTDTLNNEETILWLGYLTEDMCKQVNKIVGVTNPSDAPPVDVGVTGPWNPADRYTGTIVENERLSTAAATLSGKKAGCFEDGAGLYIFYQVLAAH